MSKSITLKELDALISAALDDLAATSDSELLRESQEVDGNSVGAGEIKKAMRNCAAAVVRRQFVGERRSEVHQVAVSGGNVERPSIEGMKKLIKELFKTNQDLKLAFREGDHQSDSDWQSLYDDLMAVGALKPEKNDD